MIFDASRQEKDPRGGLAPLIPKGFYQRDAREVARDLLGMWLCREDVVLRITEVEAYCWPDDSACHNRFGRTARNAAMWGAGGHAYVYLCYGLHQMLNVVTNPVDEAAAVLIRACEPVAGLGTIRRRRHGLEGPPLLIGPGRVGAALALDTSWSGHALFTTGALEIRRGEEPERILVGPRVGVDYAMPRHRDALWRFAVADSPWVSVRGTLRPERYRRPRVSRGT
jgi:DNA-3-methyladenine glycosylase